MKKRMNLLLAALLGASFVLGGCGNPSSAPKASETQAAEVQTTEAASAEASPEASSTADSSAAQASEPEAGSADSSMVVRVGSLKGPTSMGLVQLMDAAANGEAALSYEFTMAGKADELVGKIATGDLDIALVPANVASVLYSKTKGQVAVIDINTLGVLYVVASDDSIASMADLKGRTIYMTGKGTTPEYVVNYLLAENGLTGDDVDLQFKSEATEVASILKEDSSAIGVLPQPFAAAACIQNDALKTVLDLTEQWNLLNAESKSQLVTGVTIARSGFLAENEEAVKQFLEDHASSAAYTSEHPEEAAQMIADQGIVEKAPIAQKALPFCNIVCITGQEMKDALSGYLEVLNSQDAASIGGAMPGDDFYYMP